MCLTNIGQQLEASSSTRGTSVSGATMCLTNIGKAKLTEFQGQRCALRTSAPSPHLFQRQRCALRTSATSPRSSAPCPSTFQRQRCALRTSTRSSMRVVSGATMCLTNTGERKIERRTYISGATMCLTNIGSCRAAQRDGCGMFQGQRCALRTSARPTVRSTDMVRSGFQGQRCALRTSAGGGFQGQRCAYEHRRAAGCALLGGRRLEVGDLNFEVSGATMCLTNIGMATDSAGLDGGGFQGQRCAL